MFAKNSKIFGIYNKEKRERMEEFLFDTNKCIKLVRHKQILETLK